MNLIQSLQKKKKRQADSLVEFFTFSRSTLNDCVEIYANVLRRCLHVSVCETSRTIRKIIREYFLNSIEFKKRTSFGKFRTRCSLSLSLYPLRFDRENGFSIDSTLPILVITFLHAYFLSVVNDIKA